MINFSRRKIIKLNKMDAAIVLLEDGTVEASLPNIETDIVPENVLVGAALISALSNPELCRMMRDHFLRGSTTDNPLRQLDSSCKKDDTIT